MTISLRLPHIALVLLAALFIARPAAAVDVAAVNSHLKRAESNLQLVNGSIGHLTSPPKGSAAKLSKMRLDQAFGDIEPAGTMLKTLSGPGVAEATTRYNEAVTLYNTLAGILSGKAASPKPEPKPGDTPSPAPTPDTTPKTPGTVKLGYPHADNLKNTLFTLREVEGYVASLMTLLEQARPVADQLTINHRTTGQAMATIAEGRRKAGFVDDGLAKIPANGEGVAEAKQRLITARAKIDTADMYFKPLHAKLMALVDPANYPEFDTDVKRLRELSQMYGYTDSHSNEGRAAMADAFTQQAAAKDECIRIARKYARLMEQKTDQGTHIESTGNHFLSTHAEFLATAETQKQTLPTEIREHLAEADQYAEEAVAEQKPMWFTGGIPQRMEWATDKLALYAVLDPQGAAGVKAEVAALEASLAKRADSLKELIIRENKLPNDAYAGGDRDIAIAEAVAAWRKEQPGMELLTVRIPSDSWKRSAKWSYSNGTWYFSDVSRLQVRLIVADEDNAEQVVDRPINVYRDHESGDSLSASPLHGFSEPLQPSSYLLRSRVK